MGTVGNYVCYLYALDGFVGWLIKHSKGRPYQWNIKRFFRTLTVPVESCNGRSLKTLFFIFCSWL